MAADDRIVRNAGRSRNGRKEDDDETSQTEGASSGRAFTPTALFLILGVLVLVFTTLQGTAFLSLENFSIIAVDASELLLLGVGLTFVIITAGIDLSVGSVLVLSSVVAAQVMVNLSGTPEQVQNYQFPNQSVGIPGTRPDCSRGPVRDPQRVP